MIEILGPTVSPFVVKIIAAADYKRLSYTHREDVSIRELSKLNPVTGKVPVVVFDGDRYCVDWSGSSRRHRAWDACPTTC